LWRAGYRREDDLSKSRNREVAVRGPNRSPHLADEDDIVNWSRRIASFSQFPGIVRMLLSRNNDQITRLDMRDAEGVRAPGYDGIVEASRGTTFVPAGRSVCEMGVDADFRDKANREYKKRTKDPLGEDQAETTFVFVTPQRWPGKEHWERERRGAGPWKDVRVLDVDNLMPGLDEAAAVHVRLSELLGKAATDVQSVEDWWNRFCAKTSPAVSAGIALAGRADSAAQLLSLLEESRSLTTVRARSTDDVLAFVAATMLTTPMSVRTKLLARTLVVYDAAALRRLDSAENLLILLPFEEEMRRAAELVVSNHIVFMCQEDLPGEIELPPIGIAEVTKLLIDDGVDRELADKLGKAAGISLERFRRVASERRTPQPAWLEAFSNRDIRRAWLLQSWTTARSGDLEAFARFVGAQFGEVEETLRKVARAADPVFSTVGTVWSVTSPADLWEQARRHVSGSDLEALERTVQDVFGAVDPALELPPDQRWLAGARGKARIHSPELRRGLATTLALIGTTGVTTGMGDTTTGAWVHRVLRSLFDRANADATGEFWASLTDVLPMLAEAAPDVFLSKLNFALAHPDTALSQMFADNQEELLTTASPHTGLLWALEVTAWLPDHFGQSVNALAALSEIDPGGRLSNRPFESLKAIFRPWLPQTLAGRSERLTSLNRVVGRHPRVGPRLLIDLLPSGHDTAMPNAKPKFRANVPGLQRADPREWVETTTKLVSILLPLMREQSELWPNFIGHLNALPPADRNCVHEELPQSIEAMEPTGRLALWSGAADLIRRHREYSDAAWALPEEELVLLEAAIDPAKPSDPRAEVRWLFDESHPDVGARASEGFQAYEAWIRSLRVEAISRVLDELGMDGVEEFARTVNYPRLVGWILGEIDQ
jgi:hypothetical protein